MGNFFKNLWVRAEVEFLSLEERELSEILSVFTTMKAKLTKLTDKLESSISAKEVEIKLLESEIGSLGATNLQVQRVMTNLEGLTK